MRSADPCSAPSTLCLCSSSQKLCTELSTGRERLFTPPEWSPGHWLRRSEGRQRRPVTRGECRGRDRRDRRRTAVTKSGHPDAKFNRSPWNQPAPGPTIVVARYAASSVSRETPAQDGVQTNGHRKHGYQLSLQPHRRKQLGPNPQSYPPRYPQRYPPIVHSVARPPSAVRNTLEPPKILFRDSVEPNPNRRNTLVRRPPAKRSAAPITPHADRSGYEPDRRRCHRADRNADRSANMSTTNVGVMARGSRRLA